MQKGNKSSMNNGNLLCHVTAAIFRNSKSAHYHYIPRNTTISVDIIQKSIIGFFNSVLYCHRLTADVLQTQKNHCILWYCGQWLRCKKVKHFMFDFSIMCQPTHFKSLLFDHYIFIFILIPIEIDF